MKLGKKLCALLLTVMVGAFLAAVPASAYADIQHNDALEQRIQNGTRVLDQDDLLSTSEESSLDAKAIGTELVKDVAAFYITVPDIQGCDSVSDFADQFCDEYDLTHSASKGCVLFVVCLSESQFALISSGDVEETLTSDELNHISNDVSPYLGRSDWAGAGETFFGDVEQTLNGQRANSTTSVAYNGTYVVDDYGLFSDTDRAELEATATSLAQKYNMGVYLLVVDYMDGYSNPTSAQRTNFATSFYRAHDLGLGSGKDGIMLVIAVDSRDYVTIAYGQGSYSFSDEGIAAMEDAVKDKLGDDDWIGGCETYYDTIGEQLEYYDVRGEPWTEPDLISFILKILAALGIPAGVAFGKVSREKSAMRTAREKTEANNYLVPGSFALTHANDRYLRTDLVATPIPKHEDHDSDSGGGFGGGGWGGGGGGGFSSSGGGKF